MKISLIGEKTTNNRIGMFMNALFYAEQYEIVWDGRSSNINFIKRVTKILSDIASILKTDVVYFAPFTHSKIKLLKLAYWLKKYIVVDFYVSFYDMMVNDRHIYRENTWKARKMQRIDSKALTLANMVFFLNNAEKDYYLKCSKVDPNNFDKYLIVPLVFSKPKKMRNSWNNYPQKETLRCLWMGSFVPLHGLDKVIEACKILSQKGFDFELTIWGTNDEVARPYTNQVKSLDIEKHIKFRNDWHGVEYYHSEIRKYDLILGIFGESQKAKTVVANKVIDAVMNKTPLLTGESKGIREFFSGQDDIWIVENSPNIIAEEIIKISQLEQDRIKMNVENAYRIYLKHFSDIAFNKKIADWINSIIGLTNWR